MKKTNLVLVLITMLALTGIPVKAAVNEPAYLSSFELSVLGSNAYLIKSTGGSSQLVQYSFPTLTQGTTLTLDDDFLYAYGYTDGIVVYNYAQDVTTDETVTPDGFDKPLQVYKTVTEINSYDSNLVLKGSTSVENEYYYAYLSAGQAADLGSVDDTAEDAAPTNKCGPRANKKGKCRPVGLTRTFKPQTK